MKKNKKKWLIQYLKNYCESSLLNKKHIDIFELRDIGAPIWFEDILDFLNNNCLYELYDAYCLLYYNGGEKINDYLCRKKSDYCISHINNNKKEELINFYLKEINNMLIIIIKYKSEDREKNEILLMNNDFEINEIKNNLDLFLNF